ncbi:GNAT family N-acetyltransferase [Spongiivirga sp. MCCC 1A20706]|uniref:GNAT family N-acetyltransferase n=1 Tax=Spongiivirga sp. MCCC 1A20706 TaxID=3160963 RepID=UPI003977693E
MTKSNTYKARPAVDTDLPVLDAFLQGIIEAERPMDPTLKDDHIIYYDLESYIDQNDTYVVVVETEGEIVGSGYGQIRRNKDYFKYPYYGYIGFMFTKVTHRSQGVAKMIIDYINIWFAERKISEVRLTVYDKNSPAIRAYEKAGFKKHLIEMRMNLDEH